MYKIEIKDYGFKLTFGGYVPAEEMMSWIEESINALENASKSFNVLVDMRTLKALPYDSKLLMQEGQELYKAKGMLRSVVIVSDVIIKMQFKKIARESHIYDWERYIDASEDKDWENTGMNWILKGVDPDSSFQDINILELNESVG